MSRYAFLDRHLPSLARPLGWLLDGLARFQGPMQPPPARTPRVGMTAQGDLAALNGRQKRPAALMIGQQDWLSLSLDLPPVSADALRDIISHEVADRTPFAASDVWIGWSQGAAHVVRKDVVAKALQDAAAQGRNIRWLVPQDTQTAEVIDLAPPREKPFRLAELLGLGTLLLAGLFAGAQYVDLQDLRRERAALTTTLTTARDAAAQAAVLRNQIAAMEDASSSALPAALLPDRPPVHVLLEEVTRAVPDNSYLTRLEITADAIRLSGISAAPEALVRRLEQSPSFEDTRFDGPVTRDQAGNRVTITMQIAGAAP